MLDNAALSKLRPYGLDLRKDLPVEGGSLVAWTTVAPVNPSAWQARGARFEIVPLSGPRRGEVLTVTARTFNTAMGW